MQILTWMFLVGITGSLGVVVLSFIGDLGVLLGRE
jgi:hypothetical protein